MDIRTTIKYVIGLNAEELSSIPEVSSISGLKRIVKPVLAGFGEGPAWFYVSPRRDHIVVPHYFCTCKDYTIRVMARRHNLSCKHVLAQRLSEITRIYRIVVLDINEYIKILAEILRMGISPTLRRLLYKQKTRHKGSGRKGGKKNGSTQEKVQESSKEG